MPPADPVHRAAIEISLSDGTDSPTDAMTRTVVPPAAGPDRIEIVLESLGVCGTPVAGRPGRDP